MTNTNFCDDESCKYYMPAPRDNNCGHDPPFVGHAVRDGFYSCFFYEHR